MMAKFAYSVEVDRGGRWIPLVKDEARSFAYGYYLGCMDSKLAPRLAHRLVRSDGKVTDSFEGNPSCSLGQIAGMPTPEQYESAAMNALEAARILREMDARK